MLKNQLEIGTKINHLEASEMSMPRTLSERSAGVNRCLEGMERLRWNLVEGFVGKDRCVGEEK